MRNWTLEQRQRQSELIKTWKPWDKSTGAKTSEGKAISSMNAYKTGEHTKEAKQSRQDLRELWRQIDEFIAEVRS